MTHARLILSVVLVASALSWGCARNTPTTTANSTKPLEARVEKLEQEIKSLVAARNDLQTKLAATEAKLQQEQARGNSAERERDEVRAQLKSRTAERDATQAQYEAFRKTIRELLGQADTAAAKPMPSSGSPTAAINANIPAVGGL